MKKIYSLSLLLLGVLGFSSCSDDTENPYASESSIKVVKNNLSFDAAASEGFVIYTSNGNVTATTSASWCKAVVSGDTVKVTVAQNNTKNGRGAMVTLHQGTDTLNLPVLQQGILTKIEKSTVSLANDDAASLRYGFSSTVDLSVISYPDWATANIANDSLYVDVTANTTGHLRSGYIVYGSESYVDSIKVYQADFDKDIAGQYTLYYETSLTDPTQKSLRRKTLSETSLYINATLSLPISYDGENGTLTVTSGSYLGTNVLESTTYQVYLCYGMGDYWSAYNTDIKISAELTYDDVEGTCAQFKGVVGQYDFGSFMFRRFTTKDFTQDNDASSSVYNLTHPMLKRNPTTAAASAISSYIRR